MMNQLLFAQSRLNHHPLFNQLNSIDQLRFFMESHVFAVWDFMSLLKRLQKEITCVELPWRPSTYPAMMVRLINQIVVGEESDVDLDGNPSSHFDLYLKAMKEVGADTTQIKAFLEQLDFDLIPEHVRPFTRFTLEMAQEKSVIEVAASFFYGREKLIPGMFESIIAILEQEKLDCPTLLYYLERHVHVDAEEHGPLSEQCLSLLCGSDETKKELALSAGLRSLQERQEFWDRTLQTMLFHSGISSHQ